MQVDRGLLPSVPGEARQAAMAYATNLMQHDLPVLFDQRHLAHVTGVSSQVLGILRTNPSRFYSFFRVSKRNGGSRLIAAPTPLLKRVQLWIHAHICREFETHPACHGFVSGRSIATNAQPHVGAKVVLKLDLQDFFGTVTRRMVFRTLRRAGYAPEVADLLTSICTLNGHLPQGAPTSPAFANNAGYKLDARLAGLANRKGASYTRYADDLTLSGGSDVPWSAVRRVAEKIVRDEGFRPNERKTRFMDATGRQSVTGLVVNEKLNWPRARRRWLRQEVYYVGKYGVDDHLIARGVTASAYKEFIYGHVYALNLVAPGEAADHLTALAEVEWPY